MRDHHTRTDQDSGRSRRQASALVDSYIRELSRRRVRRPINTGPQSGHFYMPETRDPW